MVGIEGFQEEFREYMEAHPNEWVVYEIRARGEEDAEPRIVCSVASLGDEAMLRAVADAGTDERTGILQVMRGTESGAFVSIMVIAGNGIPSPAADLKVLGEDIVRLADAISVIDKVKSK